MAVQGCLFWTDTCRLLVSKLNIYYVNLAIIVRDVAEKPILSLQKVRKIYFENVPKGLFYPSIKLAAVVATETTSCVLAII